jgi:hypothetical protein
MNNKQFSVQTAKDDFHIVDSTGDMHEKMQFFPTSKGSIALRICCNCNLVGTLKLPAKVTPGILRSLDVSFKYDGSNHLLEVEVRDVSTQKTITRFFDLRELAAARICRFVRFCGLVMSSADDSGTARRVKKLFLMSASLQPKVKGQKRESITFMEVGDATSVPDATAASARAGATAKATGTGTAATTTTNDNDNDDVNHNHNATQGNTSGRIGPQTSGFRT